MTPSSKAALCAAAWLTAGFGVAEARPVHGARPSFGPRPAMHAGAYAPRRVGYAAPQHYGYRPAPMYRPGPAFYGATPPGWSRPVVSSYTVPSHGPRPYAQPYGHARYAQPYGPRYGYARPYGYRQGYYGRAALLGAAASGAIYGATGYADAPLTQTYGEPPLLPAPSYGTGPSYGYASAAPQVIYTTAAPPPPSNVQIVYGTNALYGYGAQPAPTACNCAQPAARPHARWRHHRPHAYYKD